MKNIFVFLILSGIICWGCEKTDEVVKPVISIRFAEIIEGNNGIKTANINLSLDTPSEEDIVLTYFTKDSTAKASKDYVGISEGSIIIAAGQQTATIPLEIISDTDLEFTEYFTLRFAEPDNAVMSGSFTTVIIRDDDEYTIPRDADGFITPEQYDDLVLVWQDEFNGPVIDMNNWTFEYGASGWGNQESQEYTDDEKNARIENGKLIITAVEGGGDTYTSARMITKGKQKFTFGRIDIRAKLPYGQGIWPALWMLGANIDEVGWPACGEIDIMELVGHEPYKTHGTAHYNNNGHEFKGGAYAIGINETFADEFHVFSILWEHNRINWYVDYNKFYEFTVDMTGNSYPFNDPHFFIFNVAVGGLWPGYPDETTVFPQSMTVDYVRVFQQE